MTTGSVKLLGVWASPYVNRVEIALKIKSIESEFIQENMLNKSELLLKSNPVYKKIPVLFHDEKPICESLVILQHIDEAWPSGPSILPSDPYDRAIARFWASYIDEKWYPLIVDFTNAEGKEAKAAVLEKMSEGNLLLEEAFIKISKGKSFFGGDRIGYLDIVLGSLLGWVKTIEMVYETKILDEIKMPSLAEWDERFCMDNVVKDIIPQPEKLVEVYRKYINRKKATSN
ncbi:Glutathione S-transferase U18 [Capsicum chinense]|nr:Glutathione S-transferase U18 [Capsicum chinense]